MELGTAFDALCSSPGISDANTIICAASACSCARTRTKNALPVGNALMLNFELIPHSSFLIQNYIRDYKDLYCDNRGFLWRPGGQDVRAIQD